MFKALVYAYVLGGLTFVPLVVALAIFITIYTSVPVGDPDMAKKERKRRELESLAEGDGDVRGDKESSSEPLETNDLPTTRKAWLTMRRTFEETEDNTSYVTLVRSFLDARSKDPKRSRPKDMWFVVLKRNILYLYEDEGMTECGAVIELSRHDVIVYPEGLPDAELFTRRNAICLRQKPSASPNLASLTREMKHPEDVDLKLEKSNSTGSKKEKERTILVEEEKRKDAARGQAFDATTPWFIFVRSPHEMEDWYFALLHAATNPPQTRTLHPLAAVFDPTDMNHLVSTLDDQPDVIPMRWLNALLGRIFFSHYRTHNLEAYIIGRLMKKIEKVKRPQFLTSIAVTEVSVGSRPPMLSKPMLKELTKEGDASLEVHLLFKGEIRITVEATAVINLGARFKSYTVKLVLAVVLKELEGNLLVKVKRPPSNRIWYAFTQMPRMVLEVEPIVSDRQITWGMILGTIESQIKQVIQESVVLPNMDDIAYFDSIPYEFRGGIWSDASRHTHPMPSQPTPPEMTDDTLSVASAPVPATTTDPGLEPPFITASRTEEPLPVKSTSSSSSQEASGFKVIVDDPTDSDQNNARRKTWFSSVRSVSGNGTTTHSVPDLFEPPDDETELGRGRTGHSDDASDRQRSRSRSRARSSRSTRSNKSLSGDQDIASIVTQSLRRSLSRHSNREMFDAQSGEDDAVSDTRQGQNKSNPTTPQRKPSGSSQQKRSPSPPSFFSTLKSKAGDKQALSNTAKEAMRKWGWGAKRESTGGSGSEDNDGASSSRLTVGGSSSQGHKPRTSYAEVRAAVAERKEKEKQAEHSTSRPTSPLPASEQPQATRPASSSTGNETPINSSIASAAALLANPRLSTKKSTPSMSRVNTDIDAEPHTGPESLIHVQPKAKVMAIPGIHASHRGEIQSMGYVAPQPAPAPPTMLEARLKNPAIQTVYRFWRKGSVSNSSSDQVGETSSGQTDNQGAPQPSSSSSSPPSQGSGLDQHKEGAVDGTLKTELESQSIGGRPTPPPLPPRTTLVSGGATPPSSNGRETPQSVDSAWNLTPPLTPASAALKDIVSKDENTRNRRLSQEQPNIQQQHAAESVNEEDINASEKPRLPPAAGALNAVNTTSQSSLQTSDNASAGESNLSSNVSRTPPPLPPRRHSVQAAAG